MKLKFSLILVIFFAIVISQKISAQPFSAVSIISSDIYFLRTEVTKSNSGPVYNGNVTQVITYYENDYYSLKLSIKINENIDTPLDIKLTSSKEKENIYRLEENIRLLKKDEFYHYNLEIILKEPGWYKLEFGDFSKNENGTNTSIVFDEIRIYVKK